MFENRKFPQKVKQTGVWMQQSQQSFFDLYDFDFETYKSIILPGCLTTKCGNMNYSTKPHMFISSRFYSTVSKILPHAQKPSPYTLITLKSFPSLEPLNVQPVSNKILGLPLRRDLLWRSVVLENSNRRVGSSNPPSRSTNGYSRKKLAPQKGTGNARVGDANSPSRHNGGRALARTAPNNYKKDIPRKMYSLAIRTALSYQYKLGNLIVIGDEGTFDDANHNNKNKHLPDPIYIEDLNYIDLQYRKELNMSPNQTCHSIDKFLLEHSLNKQRLLFITNELRENLIKYTDKFKAKIDVIEWEGIEVNDILKANKIFIEWESFKSLSCKYSKDI